MKGNGISFKFQKRENYEEIQGKSYHCLVSLVGLLKLNHDTKNLTFGVLQQFLVFLFYQCTHYAQILDKDQISGNQSIINITLGSILGRDTDIMAMLPNATCFLQILIAFYPLNQPSIFDDLISNAQFLIIFLCFKVNKVKSDKEFFWRLFGVCLALANKVENNDQTIGMVLFSGMGSIILIAALVLNFLIESQEQCQTYPKYTEVSKTVQALQVDSQVWETQELSSFLKTQFLQVRQKSFSSSKRQSGSKYSSSQNQDSKQSKQSKSSNHNLKVGENASGSQDHSNTSQFIIGNSNSDKPSLEQQLPQQEEKKGEEEFSVSNDPVCDSKQEYSANEMRVSKQSSTINDYFLNNLTYGFMVCNLSNAPSKRNSDNFVKLGQNFSCSADFQARSLDQNVQIRLQNKNRFRSNFRKPKKVQFQHYQKSENFFKQLPFYSQVSKQQSSQKLDQSEESNSLKVNLLQKGAKSLLISRGQIQQLIESSDENISLNVNSKQNFSQLSERERISLNMRDQLMQRDLSVTEEHLLEMKVYQPYFISNNTIIQFEGSKKRIAEKLSILDIMESFFLDHQTKSSLFFKVNLGDKSELDLLQKENSLKGHCRGGLLNSMNSISNDSQVYKNLLDSIPNQMEEIKEQNNEHGSNQSKNVEAKKRKNKGSSKYGIQQRKKKEHRRSSQEMNEIINSLNSEADEDIQPRARKSGNLMDLKVKIIEVSESESYKSSESQSEFHLHDEGDDVQINESIENSDSSQATFKDYKDNNHQYPSRPSENKQDLIRYFEFELQQVDDIKGHKNLTFIVIKDVTKLVQGQQKFCDIVYQDAIENNFSHEQMTPLNPIMTSTTCLKQKIIGLYREKYGAGAQQNPDYVNVEKIDYHHLQFVMKHSSEAKSVMQMLLPIEQSAKLIWYYNTSNINRMKIKKNELHLAPYPITKNEVNDIISEVLWPFEMILFRRRHNLHILKQIENGIQMIADWKLYEQILFNLFQNSVKYNKSRDGDILIVLKCKPLKVRANESVAPEYNAVFETMIIDTGIGIQKDRQSLLFIPFLELKDQLGIMKSQNDNLGIGLSCSKDICIRMGGDIALKVSQEGLTAFSFKIPIKVIKKKAIVEDESISQSEWEYKGLEVDNEITRLVGSERPIPDAIQSYLRHVRIFQNNNLESENRDSMEQSRSLSKSKSNGSKRTIIYKQPSVITQRYGFFTLENTNCHMSGSQSSIRQNSSALPHLKKPKKNPSEISSQLQDLFKNNIRKTPRQLSSGDKQGMLKFSHERMSSFSGDQDSSQYKSKKLQFRASVDLEELKSGSKSAEKKKEEFKIATHLAQENDQENSSEEQNNGEMLESVFEIDNEEAKEVNTEEEMKEEVKEEVKQIEQEEEKKESLPKKVSRVSGKMFSQLAQSVISEEQSQSVSYSVENSMNQPGQEPPRPAPEKKQIAKQDSALAFKAKNMINQIEGTLKKQCVDHLLINNHKNLVYRVFDNQEIRQNDFEIEVEDDQDEEVQNILIQSFANCQDHMCVRLANLSQDSEHDLDDSIDIIDLEPKGFQRVASAEYELSGINPSQSQQAVLQYSNQNPSNPQHPVIRPEDFILDGDNALQENAQQMMRQQERQSIENYNNQSISGDESEELLQDGLQEGFESNIVESFDNNQNFQLGNGSNSLGLPRNESIPAQQLDPHFSLSNSNQPIGSKIKRKKSVNNHRGSNKLSDELICCQPRVLCVDDGDMNLMALRMMLQNAFQIIPDEAENGQIAIDMFKQGLNKECKCKNRAYKLILMDIQMPVKDGFQATQEILHLVAQENVRVGFGSQAHQVIGRLNQKENDPERSSGFCNILAVTSYTTDEVRDECLRIGMKRVLHKPVNANQLPEIIDKYFYQ